ncbi:MAG: hypothetical protein HYZ63_02565 [Candidatus Andersenbacteria bacterium]|nr:hypothetical protein [Candidatus Andersenbacteria bacterium]
MKIHWVRKFMVGLIVCVALVVIGALLLSWKLAANPTPDLSNEVFCTQEVRACPDGSYTGRIGSSCEFSACPGE